MPNAVSEMTGEMLNVPKSSSCLIVSVFCSLTVSPSQLALDAVAVGGWSESVTTAAEQSELTSDFSPDLDAQPLNRPGSAESQDVFLFDDEANGNNQHSAQIHNLKHDVVPSDHPFDSTTHHHHAFGHLPSPNSGPGSFGVWPMNAFLRKDHEAVAPTEGQFDGPAAEKCYVTPNVGCSSFIAMIIVK